MRFMRRSIRASLMAVFAAVHVILYLLSFGLWRNWAIYFEPIEGIILGPYTGFSVALIGSIIARTLKPDSFWIFGIVAEPLGVLASAFLARGKWKPVMALYTLILAAYFINPIGRSLPLWTISDILIAFFLIYPVARISRSMFGMSVKRFSASLILISFIGTAMDALTRVFLLIPAGLYLFFGWSQETLYSIFIIGAVDSFVEDVYVVVVSLLVGVPVLAALQKMPQIKSFLDLDTK